MKMQNQLWCKTLATTLILSLAGVAWAQGPGSQGMGANMKDMKFAAFPGMPACATGSVQSGDPAKGPSIILAKATAGCTIPWHWHTPAEHLMMVSGVGHVDMKNAKPLTLRAGGFAMMPSRHVHQFRCVGPCALYVYSDAAFDVHYVDPQGKEIPPDQALKASGKQRHRK